MIRTNVAIRTKSSELIDFMYPNFMRTSEFSPFIESGVIFEGDSKYLQMFRDANIPYIYVKGTPEYDLTIPKNLLTFVLDKWDKKPSSTLLEMFSVEKITDELENIAKQIWVTGKYITDEEDEVKQMSKMYSLFARGSSYDLMEEFLKLSSDISTDNLFCRIKKFIKSSNNIKDIRNAKVAEKVKAFRDIRGKNIREALMGYLYSPADSVEIKLLKLFDVLTKIERK